MKHTLYMAEVIEHEWESGWGASTRPDGIAFCSDKDLLDDYFNARHEDAIASNTPAYELFETIDKPVLVEVDNNCIHFYNYKTVNTTHKVLWLRGESLSKFMEGVSK